MFRTMKHRFFHFYLIGLVSCALQSKGSRRDEAPDPKLLKWGHFHTFCLDNGRANDKFFYEELIDGPSTGFFCKESALLNETQCSFVDIANERIIWSADFQISKRRNYLELIPKDKKQNIRVFIDEKEKQAEYVSVNLGPGPSDLVIRKCFGGVLGAKELAEME